MYIVYLCTEWKDRWWRWEVLICFFNDSSHQYQTVPSSTFRSVLLSLFMNAYEFSSRWTTCENRQTVEINSYLSVQQVCEESEELLRQALEEKEEENRKRYELIQQIRAIESTPSIRHKFVDLTEVSSKGKTTVFT